MERSLTTELQCVWGLSDQNDVKKNPFAMLIRDRGACVPTRLSWILFRKSIYNADPPWGPQRVQGYH